MSQQPEFILSVITGPNAGASTPIGAGRFVLGGGKTDDIVLDGVADGAIALTLGGSRVRFAPATDGISVGESLATGATIKSGTTHLGSLPTMIRLGDDTVVSLARRRPEAKSSFRLPAAAALAVLALVGGTTLGMQLGDTAPAVASRAQASEGPAPVTAMQIDLAAPVRQTLPDRVTLPVTDAEAPPPPPPPPGAFIAARAEPGLTATSPRLGPCSGDCLTAAATALRGALEVEGLTTITVEPADGLLRVSGSLPEGKVQQWQVLRSRFEGEFGQSLPLTVALDDAAAGPSIAVSSVWLGDTPEVRTKTGQILRVGDETADGWTVQAIKDGEIALQRDAQIITVSF